LVWLKPATASSARQESNRYMDALNVAPSDPSARNDIGRCGVRTPALRVENHTDDCVGRHAGRGARRQDWRRGAHEPDPTLLALTIFNPLPLALSTKLALHVERHPQPRHVLFMRNLDHAELRQMLGQVLHFEQRETTFTQPRDQARQGHL